jgi:hypothetical protein
VKALSRKRDGAERRTSERRTQLLRIGALLDGRPERILRCSIKDLSDGGARLRVPVAEVVGDDVTLIDPRDGTERRARIVWRSEHEVGIAFTGDVRLGRPRSVDQP